MTPAPRSGQAHRADAVSDQTRRFQRRQLELLNRQAARIPLPLLLTAGLVAYSARDAVDDVVLLAWMGAVALLLAAHWQFARRAMTRPDAALGAALRGMALLGFCNGMVHGGAALLLLPELTSEGKAVVTMLMVCWSAGAATVNAGYTRGYFAYTFPLLGMLAAAWSYQGDVAGVWNAVLILLLLGLQSVFVRENERLLQALAVEREAVARERDRAEEANRMKTRFLAAASHDLRQPLHTLSLYSAALAVRPGDETTQEMSREIGKAIGALGSLLDSLLDISRLDAGAVNPELERFALGPLLARIARETAPLAQQKGLALECSVQDSLFVRSDPALLERIVRNLVDNAIKYTPAGKIRLEARPAGGVATVTVSDTGPGIALDEQERVFEEFYQVSASGRDRSLGIGLGLAIVRRLTRLLDIDLTLDSDVGSGARFVLSLELAPGQGGGDESPSAAWAEEVALPCGARILVIDDEASVREGMRLLLQSWGCSVIVAEGTREALAALPGAGIELIIADQRLSGAETGVELIRRARRIVGAVPVLLVTGDTGAELVAQARELEITVLRKPVPDSLLRQAVAAALYEKAG